MTILSNSTDTVISIGCFNTRSIVNKLSLLDHYLHQNNNPFGILFVTESWLNLNILDSMICNSNFNILRDDRCTCVLEGGVLLLYENSLDKLDKNFIQKS